MNSRTNWTAASLVVYRWKESIRYQWRVWRSALDWTVWLYFVVPFFWIGGGLYVDLWIQTPDWLLTLPPWFAALPILSLFLLAQLNLYVEEADRLFLLQRRDWMNKLVRLSAWLGAGGCLLSVLAGGILVLPFLSLGLQLTPVTIGVWLMLSACIVATLSVAANLTAARWQGWQNKLPRVVFAALMAALYVPLTGYCFTAAGTNVDMETPRFILLLAAAAASALGWAILLRVKQSAGCRAGFEADVAAARRSKLASTEMLLAYAVDPKAVVKGKRPLLFRGSRRIFRSRDAGAVLAEMKLKTFARQSSSLRIYLSFLGASSAAVALSPDWLAFTLAAVLPALLAQLLQLHWKLWLEEPFVLQYPWTSQSTGRAASLFRSVLIIPAPIVYGAIAGYAAFGLTPLAAACAAGGALYGWLFCTVLQTFALPWHRPGREGMIPDRKG